MTTQLTVQFICLYIHLCCAGFQNYKFGFFEQNFYVIIIVYIGVYYNLSQCRSRKLLEKYLLCFGAHCCPTLSLKLEYETITSGGSALIPRIRHMHDQNTTVLYTGSWRRLYRLYIIIFFRP